MRAETVLYLSRLLHAERRRRGTRSGTRTLSSFRQAALVIRWLLDATRVRQLAVDNGIGKTTAYERLHEGIDVLAAQAPNLHGALLAAKAAGYSRLNIDGTLIETDRVAAPGPTEGVDLWWSGKHHTHLGMTARSAAQSDARRRTSGQPRQLIISCLVGVAEGYAAAMSRGHGRVQRIILQSVNGTRYGCTVPQLAYVTYGIDREDGPSEAQIAAVRRAVSRLLREERVVERVMFGTDRYILPATPPVSRQKQRRATTGTGLTHQHTLQCTDCDIRWVSEERAPHRLCWSCGEPGKPARAYVRKRLTDA